MPRVLIFSFFVFFFWVNAVNASDLSTFVYISEDALQSGQVISLTDLAYLDIPAGSLNHSSRISLAKSEQSSELSEDFISDVFSWQILDAEINTSLSLVINNKFVESFISVYKKVDNGWEEVSYENTNNGYKILITDSFGSIVIAEKNFFEYSIVLDAETVAKGYPVKTPDGYFEFHILSGVFSKEITVNIKSLSSEVYSPNAGLSVSSPIYYFYIDSDEDINKDLAIDIKFIQGDENNKEIYYWDNQNLTWHISPSETNYTDGVVRTFTHQKEMIIGVFSGKIMEEGVASWYAWKNGDFAASPDYPKGTKLKVTNIANRESVIITVNDYGPDRSIHPERVIDLDKVAFNKIANPRMGLIDVSVELIYFK